MLQLRAGVYDEHMAVGIVNIADDFSCSGAPVPPWIASGPTPASDSACVVAASRATARSWVSDGVIPSMGFGMAGDRSASERTNQQRRHAARETP